MIGGAQGVFEDDPDTSTMFMTGIVQHSIQNKNRNKVYCKGSRPNVFLKKGTLMIIGEDKNIANKSHKHSG